MLYAISCILLIFVLAFGIPGPVVCFIGWGILAMFGLLGIAVLCAIGYQLGIPPVVLLLVGFVAFWRYLVNKNKRDGVPQ